MGISKLKKQNFKKILKIAEKSIREGKILICPTDTVYGLICDATNKKAVEKIFKIKKRSKKKPIPIFVKDIKTAKSLAFVNKNQEKYLKSVWPGRVTVVLKRKPKIKIHGLDKKTIALRIPNYKLVNILLKKLNLPLTATSANISGKPPSTKIKEVLKQFKCKNSHGRIRIPRGRRPRVALFACPDLVLDAGNLPKSKPSTVLDLTVSPPKILRP